MRMQYPIRSYGPMPISPRQNARFYGKCKKFISFQRADVGIGPYNQASKGTRIRRIASVFTVTCRLTTQALRANSPFRGALGRVQKTGAAGAAPVWDLVVELAQFGEVLDGADHLAGVGVFVVVPGNDLNLIGVPSIIIAV